MTHRNDLAMDSGSADTEVRDSTSEIGLPRHPDEMYAYGNEKTDPDADLLKRAKWWARLLGMDHWRIGITTSAGDRQLGETSTARVRCSDNYDEAIVMIRGDKPSTGLYSSDALAYSQDESLIHEFLHVVFREMDVTVDDALQLIADDKAREVFQGRITMRQEQVVERLTRILTTLVGSQGQHPDTHSPPSSGSIVVDHSVLENPTFHDKSYKPERPDSN